MSESKPVLCVQGISIDAIKSREEASGFRAERILSDVDVFAQRGEILLLLGPSGSGKSLLTNLLLGLVTPLDAGLMIEKGPHSKFSVDVGKDPIDLLASPVYPSELEGKIGIMFQSLGLFDDLTVQENLAFANDQARVSRRGNEWKLWPRDMIVHTLGLPESVLNSNVGKFSGGQKQRVALGRLLAFRPQIMIFDEPTSALDPNSARRVVSLIEKTHRENDNLLTIIITHDYENFLAIADRVWFITAQQQIKNHMPPNSGEYYHQALTEPRTLGSRELPLHELAQHRAKLADLWWNSWGRRAFSTLRKITRVQSYFWFLRYFWVMLKLLIVRAIPYHLASGLFLGLVTTYFTLHLKLGDVNISGSYVPVEKFIVPTFFREMLSGFAVVMFRALIPLFTCIFIAARSGTAVTAYLSNMRDSDRRQWDAMRTFGVEPNMFFFPQIVLCFVVGCLVLSYLSFLIASLGSLFVALYTNPLCTWYTWKETFWMSLRPRWIAGVLPIFDGSAMFAVKTMCAGMAIAIVSFLWGIKARKSSMDTLRHLIGANICNMLAILLIFFVLLIQELS